MGWLGWLLVRGGPGDAAATGGAAGDSTWRGPGWGVAIDMTSAS